MNDAAPAFLLPLTVALPIVGAVLAPITARISKRLPLLVCLLSMLGATALLGMLAPSVFAGHVLVHYMGHWVPVGGKALGIAFAADPFGLTYALVVGGVGSVLVLFSLSEMGGTFGAREVGLYACLYQLLLAALIGTAPPPTCSTSSSGSKWPPCPATG